MPKANRHVEVKPSKFKTALCEHYLKKKDCPFGTHCAFAHGEHELQNEERNVSILRATGIQRLDTNLIYTNIPCNAALAENSITPFLPRSSTRRRPVIISLTYWNETQLSGIGQGSNSEGMRDEEDGCLPYDERVANPMATYPSRCSSKFSASCSTEAPLMYRHNPYGLSAKWE